MSINPVSCIETTQIASSLVFAITILLIITRRLEESHAALLGMSLILILGLLDLYKAFSSYVDWNIISILIGMWILSFLLRDSGFINYIAMKIIEKTHSVPMIVLYVNILAGIITMLVDNVLVVLLLVPVTLEILRSVGVDPVKPSIMVALSANFMGTALLLGDLPPQLLHVIFGAEFMDFIWMNNKPAAFPILLLSFILTLFISSGVLLRSERNLKTIIEAKTVAGSLSKESYDKVYMVISLLAFIATVVLMALRKPISDLAGYEIRLGVFPLFTSVVTSLYLVVTRRVSFEKIIDEGIDLNAILFYIGLFILVGSLEETGVLDIIGSIIAPLLTSATYIGFTVVYWISAFLVAFVEHDAYILVMLKTFKHLYEGGLLSDPWPYNWALLFSGTLGSNYTAAGAPALYVAFRLIEKTLNRKISLREIYKTTVTYSTVSLMTCYVISLLIWAML
ncbi:MAG: SLC13 family permease [Sulfolobales archaeon]